MAWLQEQALVSSGMLSYLLITCITVLLSVWVFKRQRKVWMLNKLPGPKTLPIIGNALELRLDSIELFAKINSFCDYGGMVRIWIGPTPYILISDARAAEVVLSGSKFIEKSFDYTYLHPWLGTGLLTATGAKWHSRRKLLTPAFHFKILEDFVEVFNVQSLKLVQKLQEKADGKPFNVFPYVTRCTLDIICETAMGTSINAQDDVNNAYISAIYKIGYMIQQRVAKPWQHPNFLYKLLGYAKKRDSYIKVLHDFSLKTIRERRRIFQEKKEMKDSLEKVEKEEDENVSMKKKPRLAFLDLLLEYSQSGQALSDEDIREEVDTFMFEGHDTTTAAINWSLFLIGSHPEIQAKVHEELDNVFGNTDTPVTTADLRELKYLENCIKEALRIFPSVPFFGRQVNEDAVIGNHRIPAGTSITVMTYRMHRDPEQFPNPEVFDPDRFLPENSKGRHPFAYIPFSAGLRNCIGQKFAMMEEKIILSNILRHFRVESHETRDQIKVLGELILRPAEGIKIKMFPRNKTNLEA